MSEQKHNFCTHYVVYLYFSMNSMNNLLSYCRLKDSKMRASHTDLPVHSSSKHEGTYKTQKSANNFNLSYILRNYSSLS